MNTHTHRDIGNDTMGQAAVVAKTVMRLMAQNLQGLHAPNLTLDNLTQRLPILRDVLAALGLEGEMLRTMMESPVQSSKLVIESLLNDGTTAQRSVCNITQLQQLLRLPDSFNSTALYKAVCLNNTSEAINNIVRNLNLQDVLSFSVTSATNWTLFIQQSRELGRTIQDLVFYPPTLNSSTFLAGLENRFNTSDLWRLASLANSDTLLRSIRAVPEMRMVEGVVKSAGVVGEILLMVEGVVKWAGVVGEILQGLMDRMLEDRVTLDLASLFSSSPSFVRLMEVYLDTHPEMSLVQLFPSKVIIFLHRCDWCNCIFFYLSLVSFSEAIHLRLSLTDFVLV